MLKSDEVKFIREKLFESEKHLPPGTSTDIHDLCKCLSFRIKPGLAPLGLIRDAKQLFADMPDAHNRWHEDPIMARLIGRDPQAYQELHRSLPSIVPAFFPQDFAQDLVHLFNRAAAPPPAPVTA